MEGVVSHLGRVMSGGTALSAGIYIEEEPKYFDALRSEGADFDQRLVDDAYEWVREQVATPMDFAEPFVWQRMGKIQRRGGLFPSGWHEGMLSKRKDVPRGLEIKTRATVIRVEFDTNRKGKPRATCVQFVKSPKEAKSIDSRVSNLLLVLEDKNDETEEKAEHGQEVMRACIRPGGENFLSAGAVNTPVVLMKSGVGPRDAVENATKAIPRALRGENDGMVLEIPGLESDGLKVTMAQVAGAKRVGEGCSGSSGKRLDYNIFDSSPDCGWVTSQEFTGGRSVEGLLSSTRLILPPKMRSSPEADFLMRLLHECSSRPYEALKLIAMIAFPSLPKGRGYVTINEKGEPIVSGGYYNDPGGEDLHVAVEGLKKMIRVNTKERNIQKAMSC
ncbi:unnamed protein product [Vitrella brassicaformis CCMP3155]|uniref:Glucose-methanol-choline oxidoreductase N-terminal domain-containing protein n=1 Tax=Vitrella brassicaformis (strain CCMP3155) TaxID=1169540 RepID=A0A0G4FAW6_VITBC|nr:unnamed protein product [Vitrella brassicaformis CCMP3155]|eukprot:CEM10051.1 unnamed protein product [Vitrella brassicaformis CCMP3155]